MAALKTAVFSLSNAIRAGAAGGRGNGPQNMARLLKTAQRLCLVSRLALARKTGGVLEAVFPLGLLVSSNGSGLCLRTT